MLLPLKNKKRIACSGNALYLFPERLAFGELEAATGTGLTGFLTFFDAGITGHHAGGFQLGLEFFELFLHGWIPLFLKFC